MLIKMGIGVQEMLETSQERVKLLKAGIDGKTIEKLYITYNNFKIVSSPIFFDVIGCNYTPLKKMNKNKNEKFKSQYQFNPDLDSG